MIFALEKQAWSNFERVVSKILDLRIDLVRAIAQEFEENESED